ncbi:MAG: sialidase family protein, partial [Pyrinomonadaceae bacterium]
TTDIFMSYSDNGGKFWTAPKPVTDQFVVPVDRFNHWMSVDPTSGDVFVSFYDTRNDWTGMGFGTDVYLSQSKDGGATWLPNVRVTSVGSNEHDCNGLFPCDGINYGTQQGDYEASSPTAATPTRSGPTAAASANQSAAARATSPWKRSSRRRSLATEQKKTTK